MGGDNATPAFGTKSTHFSKTLRTSDPVLEDALRSCEQANLAPIHVTANQGRFCQLLAQTQGALRIPRMAASMSQSSPSTYLRAESLPR